VGHDAVGRGRCIIVFEEKGGGRDGRLGDEMEAVRKMGRMRGVLFMCCVPGITEYYYDEDAKIHYHDFSYLSRERELTFFSRDDRDLTAGPGLHYKLLLVHTCDSANYFGGPLHSANPSGTLYLTTGYIQADAQFALGFVDAALSGVPPTGLNGPYLSKYGKRIWPGTPKEE
jgi:hypothetical protein